MTHYLTTCLTCLTSKLFLAGLLAPLICWSVCGCVAKDPAAGSADKQEVSGARADFDRTFDSWTRMLGELHELELAYHTALGSEREELGKQHAEKLAEGYAMEDELLSQAMRAYGEEPSENEDLKNFLIQIGAILVQSECYEDGLEVSRMLLDKEIDEPFVYQFAAHAAFACSEFDLAERCLKIAKKQSGLSPEQSRWLSLIEPYKKEWEREKELRETEHLASDLPRVVLVTVRGEIELELFEDQAPNTVANFISLVEDGFYDGRAFYEVKANFGAMSGCPLDDGTGSPGHFIRHEFDEPERRVHFRGSIGTIAENPGLANGSQFCITFLPTPEREGQGTVFGRVIRGMEVLARLQRRSVSGLSGGTTPPDTIVTAKVVRKRNHPYEPHRIPDPTAEQREKRSKYIKKMLSR